jgi:hypothetical protein
MGSRQRYNHRAILIYTQDTIEGVSGLGSIAELLRGEVLSVIRCTVPLGEFMKCIACRA